MRLITCRLQDLWYFVDVIVVATSHNVELSIIGNSTQIEVSIVHAFKMREGFNNGFLICVIGSSGKLGVERCVGISICIVHGCRI